MERRFLILLVVLSALILSACGNPGIYVDVFSGNYSYSRGEYQDANFYYVKAEKRKKYPDYVAYNLGNVYYALGEVAAALDKWSYSSQSEDDTVAFASYFNRGVLLFELSRYEEAFESFKNALMINSSDINAKIDLEYCLKKMSLGKDTAKADVKVKKDPSSEGKKDDAMRILDFVKRVEKKTLEKGGTPESLQEGPVNDW